ncbi:MAG: RluA family pseudouridine synthase [Spirochaetaceae bacterium]|nr:MAG: RluA family pseudouridine synthase [Spirochaetaceae bacterium]
MTPSFDVLVPPDAPRGKRLDLYLVEDLQLCRRNRLRHQLEGLRCNGKEAKLSTRIGPGDRISGTLVAPPPLVAEGEPLDFTILRQEPLYLVIDKPQGLVVHPGAGNRRGTLVNGLLWRYRDDPFFASAGREDPSETVESFRPGIVHRLDKDTSGVMIVARNPDVHHHLVEQFARGTVKKQYLAIIRGRLVPDEGEIDAPVGRDPHHRQRFSVSPRGKAARTLWKVLRRVPGYTLVLLRPLTGRTHQLRVHMASRGTPIVGDPIYGGREAPASGVTLMLHALTLQLSPAPGHEPVLFRSAVPHRFHQFLDTHSAASNSR